LVKGADQNQSITLSFRYWLTVSAQVSGYLFLPLQVAAAMSRDI